MLQPISTITSPTIEWLWPGYLPSGGLVMLDGDPGLGKSLLTLELATRLSLGKAWPDGTPGTIPARTAILCAEDPDAVVKQRLLALGVDAPYVWHWPRDQPPGLPRFPADIERLDQSLQGSAVKLVIIDPIVAFLDATVMMNSDASVRRALGPLAQLAGAHRCTMLLVRHLNKGKSAHALYRGAGSIGLVASCRVAWVVGRDPRNHARIVLAQTKNNYAPLQPSLAYTITDGPRVEWEGISYLRSDELVVHRARRARQRACDFLRLFLAKGPRTSSELWSAAREIGLSDKTVQRAREEAKAKVEPVYREGRRFFYWKLDDQHVPDATVSEVPEVDDWMRQWRELYPPRTPLDGKEED